MRQFDLSLKNKKVVIMGLGLHGGGAAAALWCVQQGARVTVTDLRTRPVLASSLKKLKRFSSIKYVLGKHRVADFISADVVIKNPGVPHNSRYLVAARKKGIAIETDMSIFFRLCQGTIIGVTGTKGKSTTASLIYQLLKKAGHQVVLAGNIRRSPLSVLKKVTKKTTVVLELSSWQIEDMKHLGISPHISVVTNILQDHLDRHKTMRQYALAKASIFSFQHSHDVSILNYDNQLTREMGKRVVSKHVWFSRKYIASQNAIYMKNDVIYVRDDGRETKVASRADIALLGAHNVENALAAVAVARVRGVRAGVIRRVLRSFKAVPDRLELIRKWKGVSFYNDTTATMPDATVAALKSFEFKSVLIAGGTDKKLDFRQLVNVIPQHCQYLVLLPGTATDAIIKMLKVRKYSNYLVVRSMKEAVAKASARAVQGEQVILSPGAASFGLFLNEFDRGDQFRNEVKKLR